MAGNRDASQDVMDRARELYITSQVSSYKELSERSAELLGQYLTIDTVKRYGSTDPVGDWTVLRSQNRVGDANSELEDIRSVLYLDIMNPETHAQARAQLTNAYLALLAKGNMKGKASAKTTVEQALDLKAEALGELSEDDK